MRFLRIYLKKCGDSKNLTQFHTVATISVSMLQTVARWDNVEVSKFHRIANLKKSLRVAKGYTFQTNSKKQDTTRYPQQLLKTQNSVDF